MILGISGHRPEKLGGYNIPNPIYNKVISQLEENILSLKPDKVIIGMALGTDSWSAEICIKHNIPFIAAIPFIGQENFWPIESKEKYAYFLSQADEIKYVNQGGYAKWKMFTRNKWIVDNSDLMLTISNGSSSGTNQCINYAKEKNKKVIIINPHIL